MSQIQEKRFLRLENGELVDAIFPVIVSASRVTDIPAFYTDWFFERLKIGYSAWINAFNRKRYYIGYEDAKFIVFWSKNPYPLLALLDCLERRGIGAYIQFTLNNYEKEGLERNVPALAQRIHTFRTMSKRLGKKAVIWRYDPLVLAETINIDELLSRIRLIGSQIHEYTEKFVFSFADIISYKKVRANLRRHNFPYKDWLVDNMREFAQKLVELNKSEGWNLQLATCGEPEDFPGIEHNRCIDDRLILRIKEDSPELARYLGVKVGTGGKTLSEGLSGCLGNGDGGTSLFFSKNNKDRGQRKACGCVKSKDIGEYFTCVHNCLYCYASHGEEHAGRNYILHKNNPHADTITGK